MLQKRSSKHIKAQRQGKEEAGYICLLCSKQEKNNHGHHIIKYSEGGPASTNNIVTMCPECHTKYHSGEINVDIGKF